VSPLLGERGSLVAQDAVDEVVVPESVARSIIRMVRFTREAVGVELGASPRAALHLMTASKARALALGRTTVEVGDAAYLAPFVLEHRINADNAKEIAAAAADGSATASAMEDSTDGWRNGPDPR